MKELNLLEGPVRKTILQFSIPTILGMAATQLYTVADTMIIGRFMDKYALGAVSNASTVLMAFLFISGGLELGCGLLTASQKLKLEQKELSGIIHNMLFLDLLIGLLILVGGVWGMRQFLLLINTPSDIMDAAMLYGRIYLLGLPFLMLYDLSREIVISCGESRIPLLAVLASSMLNIILDLILVGPLGVAGAAAASVLAQMLGCLFMLAYLRRTVLTCSFQLHFLKKCCFRDILRLSVPNMLQQIAPPAVALVKQGLLGTLGVAEIDGFACAGRLSTLMMMPIYGLAQSLVVFIAQNHSVGAVDRVQSSIRETRNLILAYMSVVVLSCLLLNRQLLSLFTDDMAVIRCGAMLLAFESWTYMLTAMKHLQEARLRGQMKMGLYLISSLLPIGINIACCLILVPGFGYSGFYLSTFVSAPFSLLLATLLVKFGKADLLTCHTATAIINPTKIGKIREEVFQMGKFEIKTVKTGIKFNLKAGNGEIIATSEIYTSESACNNGIESVRKNAVAAKLEDQTVENYETVTNPKFEVYTDKAGEYRFRLKARNGEIIAASEGYKAKASCLNGIESVRKNAPEATVIKAEA